MPLPHLHRQPCNDALNIENAERAIELVRKALPLFRAGEPILKPDGVDVPVLYLNFAIDRLHYDPERRIPLPKGRPRSSRPFEVEGIAEEAERILKEVRVLPAAEFREPENCWVVPVAWRSFVVLHVRISADGKEIVPDYGLTEEIRRHGL
ncbi:hypothetical protein APY94_01505 [Thermococcus celericrescens]|uniref:Uncharacterized protein n=1 Tax=Thermococcus celericrescens TaxID=227598 RepID=A0A100XZG7_9EURY|nr:hypothetical protein [Thermococcus celericrescens]KUH34522.1 hypothetical protein APY94_01505 [Thermococcus celericrescens]